MSASEALSAPHRRRNVLTGEWVLVSPRRTNRPWQGEMAPRNGRTLPSYDPDWHLCSGNPTAKGTINPWNMSTFVFTNDVSALEQQAASIRWECHTLYALPAALVRSATIKKYMVGCGLLAEPQRVQWPEENAPRLRDLPILHYRHRNRFQRESTPMTGVTSPSLNNCRG